MSIHVCKCGNEWHLRYPGLSEKEAQSIADRINAGAFYDVAKVEELTKLLAEARKVPEEYRMLHDLIRQHIHSASVIFSSGGYIGMKEWVDKVQKLVLSASPKP